MILLEIGFLVMVISGIFVAGQQENSTQGDATAEPTELTTVKPLSTTPNCPSEAQISNACDCYLETKYIICTDLATGFKLTENHTFNVLILRNTKNLPRITDPIMTGKRLTVKSLVIIQGPGVNEDIPSLANLKALLSLTTDTVKITGNGVADNNVLDINDLTKGAPSLRSITITDLKVSGFETFNMEKFSQLKHLVFRNVHFSESSLDLLFTDSALQMLEISDSNVGGLVSFSPRECNPTETITIQLRNSGISNFVFKGLVPPVPLGAPARTKCPYHIDLSENNDLDANFLNEQTTGLGDALDKGLYLVLGNTQEYNCSCDLWNACKRHLNYVHFQCVTDGIPIAHRIIADARNTDFKTCH